MSSIMLLRISTNAPGVNNARSATEKKVPRLDFSPQRCADFNAHEISDALQNLSWAALRQRGSRMGPESIERTGPIVCARCVANGRAVGSIVFDGSEVRSDGVSAGVHEGMGARRKAAHELTGER